MTREELIELSDLNLAEANREMSRRAGGAVLDEDGVLYWAGGHVLPVLCNGLMRTGHAGPGRSKAAEILERARGFFAPRDRGFTVLLRAHAEDSDLAEAARDSELAAWGGSPAMVLRDRMPDRSPPPGVKLCRVASDADARAYAEVMGAAYATYGMPADVAPAVLPLDVLRAPHIAAFLARLADGTPVAGAMVLVSHRVAGIYWVGTTPAARGRGLGELVTRAAGNAGFDLGARIASLQASKMGEPLYRRMGYETVTDYPTWVAFSSRQPAPGRS